MRRAWAKLGGQLGLASIGLGLLLIGLAWNGAAGVDFVSGQIPYLLSGGALGISLVIVGTGLIVIEVSRKNRSILEAQLRELNNSVGRLTAALGGIGSLNGGAPAGSSSSRNTGEEMVVIGRSSFHRPDCRLIQGKELPEASVDGALEQGMSACRICNPADLHVIVERS